MIIDFRYHLFTVTAIFAALGLGILIGTSIIGNEGLIKEQQKIINNIAKDINYLQNKNSALNSDIRKLKQQLNYRQSKEQEFLSLVMRGKLQGERYLLLSGEKKLSDNIRTETEKIFELAGAELTIMKNYKLLQNSNNIDKIIFWGIKKNKNEDIFTEIKVNFEDNIIYCQKQNLIELMLALMESRKNEKPKKGFSAYSGL